MGSSPLTRGKHAFAEQRPGGKGLIPAHAGKTRPAGTTANPSGAHPRSRGENATNEDPASAYSGSSPLTRGKPADRALSGKWSGLIPAHAGKTCHTQMRQYLAWAHPRSRGENCSRTRSASALAGSSPLTRGKLFPAIASSAADGLIPAHAGKTLPYGQHLAATWAHPRSRGENCARASDEFHATGSSPLTRGKQYLRPHRGSRNGLIPAHAGKTLRPRARC